MQTIAVRLLLFTTLFTAACHADHAQKNAARAEETASALQKKVIHFKHADARIASNYARAEFGCPPMESVVHIECDGKSNDWFVTATPADMARVEEIAARYDKAESPAPVKGG
jgi:hypothetical protein